LAENDTLLGVQPQNRRKGHLPRGGEKERAGVKSKRADGVLEG